MTPSTLLASLSCSVDDREWQQRLNEHYLQLIDGMKQGKDDYRTCTRENSPQTAAVGRFPGQGLKAHGTRRWISALETRKNKTIRATD